MLGHDSDALWVTGGYGFWCVSGGSGNSLYVEHFGTLEYKNITQNIVPYGIQYEVSFQVSFTPFGTEHWS